MPTPESRPTPTTGPAPSEATLRVLAEFAGLPLTPDRLPLLAAQWRPLMESIAALDALDLSEAEPVTVFHAGWEE